MPSVRWSIPVLSPCSGRRELVAVRRRDAARPDQQRRVGGGGTLVDEKDLSASTAGRAHGKHARSFRNEDEDT